ncbi:cytochrome P450 [Glomus cerebriforme]|uniref:Cytochrome P450 n=1 Tax=Glomus cerebriforme TaxID=658196 RepID=A0A397TAH9_9GLOM|nr:cytochrome P450 [Glomus cerebriforme]
MAYYVKGDMTDYYKFLYQRYGNIYELYMRNVRQIVLTRTEFIENLMSNSKQSYYVLRVSKTRFKDLGSGIGYGIPIDFVPWAHIVTYEIVFQTMLGFKINKLVEYFNDNIKVSKKKDFRPSPIDKEVAKLYESILKDFSGLTFVLSYPSFIRRTVLKKKNDAMLYSKHRTDELLINIINYRRKEIEETPINEELRHDMLITLIITNTERDYNENHYIANKSSKPLTNDQIRQILLEVVAAGSDTTANFLFCYTLFMSLS